MTVYTKRMSMNTLLMNARIFDEDSSESSTQETTSSDQLNFSFGKGEIAVKEEPEEKEPEIRQSKRKKGNLKPGLQVKEEYVEVKQEQEEFAMDEESLFPCNIFDKLNLTKGTMEQYLSPVKLEIDEDTNTSIDSNSRKSAKRTVFPRESPYKARESPYNTRQSPYKRPHLEPEQSTSLYTRHEGVDRYKMRKRKAPVELETDTEILRRRQKQIDYGKNTIGYDIYTKTVPKQQRSQTDPQTPNKYGKYSRRGFDGLIKQWRLKLHKYDPPDEDENVE